MPEASVSVSRLALPTLSRPSAGPAARLAELRSRLSTLGEPDTCRLFELRSYSRVLKTTISLCPDCLEYVPAVVFSRDGRVLIRKRCEAHADSDAVLENDERFYFLSNKDTSGRRFAEDRVITTPVFEGACCGEDGCGPPVGTDQSANKTCTILIEVTNACNLACPVCYSDARGDRKLPLDTFQVYIRRLLEEKGSLDSVQLTGGEAALHPDFLEMVSFLYHEPRVRKIYLPTNGILFAARGAAEKLLPFREKLMVLLQFDGMSRDVNRSLRAANPERVRQEVLERFDELGIAMQLTMTLSHGVNEDETGTVIKTGLRHKSVKVIAMQPVTYSGRYDLRQDPMERLTLSDIVKSVAAQAPIVTRPEDFLPIPCSHPNCGWITLYVRRLGILKNIVRYVDLPRVVEQVAYKTLLSTRELRDTVSMPAGGFGRRAMTWLGKRVVRSTDIFSIAIKPFMDRFNYDQDRIANCCHHLMDTKGNALSFCEYNALLRPGDRWDDLPLLAAH